MKCRTCGDSGTIVTVDPISGKKYETKCPLCVAERKMTNEEWFNTLSTSDKAEEIARLLSTDEIEYTGIHFRVWRWLEAKHGRESE